MSSFAKKKKFHLEQFLSELRQSGGEQLQTFLIGKVVNLFPRDPSMNTDIMGLWNQSVKTYQAYLLTCPIRSQIRLRGTAHTATAVSSACSPALLRTNLGVRFPGKNKDVLDYQTPCRADTFSFYVHKSTTETRPLKCYCLLEPEGLALR